MVTNKDPIYTEFHAMLTYVIMRLPYFIYSIKCL